VRGLSTSFASGARRSGLVVEPRGMRPQLKAIASSQGGVVTRRQVLAQGYAAAEIRRLTRREGPWVVVRRGAYCEREIWEAADPYDGRALLGDRAVHLMVQPEHLMSHDSAARALGVPFLAPRTRLSHLTRYGVGGSRTHYGVKHHLTQLGLLNTVVLEGMPVTGLARTVVDLGREHGWLSGMVAADDALLNGLERADLEAELAVMRCWPGVTEARAGVDKARLGAESVGESVTRPFLEEIGLADPDLQFPVRIGGRVAWVDLRIGCHLVEFDGRKKFLRAERGGVATRPVEDLVWEERQRQLAVCRRGLGMSRLTWNEVMGSERDAAQRRVLAEYHETCARYGDVLPEGLRREAAEIRARSPRVRPRPRRRQDVA
jgi:hypothetical protein